MDLPSAPVVRPRLPSFSLCFLMQTRRHLRSFLLLWARTSADNGVRSRLSHSPLLPLPFCLSSRLGRYQLHTRPRNTGRSVLHATHLRWPWHKRKMRPGPGVDLLPDSLYPGKRSTETHGAWHVYLPPSPGEPLNCPFLFRFPLVPVCSRPVVTMHAPCFGLLYIVHPLFLRAPPGGTPPGRKGACRRADGRPGCVRSCTFDQPWSRCRIQIVKWARTTPLPPQSFSDCNDRLTMTSTAF
ncbi:hypothetical protein GQ53DRAFT_82537 [Thozetella sp. PMI_491]|nr:hypothetical protein GQ53DRAFT_82537 [Thozetella sp. PMI_491]